MISPRCSRFIYFTKGIYNERRESKKTFIRNTKKQEPNTREEESALKSAMRKQNDLES